MQTISYITRQVDAYIVIDWFHTKLTNEQVDFLVDNTGYFEFNSMQFPDEFSIKGWAGVNSIVLHTFEDYVKDFELDLED